MMRGRIAVPFVLAALVACGDDEPTGSGGLDDLDDVAGQTFELVGIGTIGGYEDLVPGTLSSGPCPGQPDLLEETEFREAELSFTDLSYVLEMRVRTHCYDPEAEVIVPDWSPVVTRQIEAAYVHEDDRLEMGSAGGDAIYGYLHEGGLRVEFEPSSGPVEQGNVLFFE